MEEKLINIQGSLAFINEKDFEEFKLYIYYNKSESIIWMAISEVQKRIVIQFKTGKVYAYNNVSLECMRRAAYAESAGTFFHREIRSVYQHEESAMQVKFATLDQVVEKYEAMRNYFKIQQVAPMV